jgi:hypothetical protein
MTSLGTPGDLYVNGDLIVTGSTTSGNGIKLPSGGSTLVFYKTEFKLTNMSGPWGVDQQIGVFISRLDSVVTMTINAGKAVSTSDSPITFTVDTAFQSAAPTRLPIIVHDDGNDVQGYLDISGSSVTIGTDLSSGNFSGFGGDTGFNSAITVTYT